LLKSYLSERAQFVCLNNSCSERLIVKNGVPQGSALGPLLFLFYIIDLQHASSLQIRLYADDTLLFHESKNLGSLQRYVNKEMLKIESWLIGNKTILNSNKTKYMLFYPCRSKVKKAIG